jgi:prepilin-type N-terminal cleavage/methylation domain-containing protein
VVSVLIDSLKKVSLEEQGRMHRTKGFTLIELLVVIAIIALLMGILMPALQRVKKQAKGVVCKNNMKQIGMAANVYAEDHDFFIPRSAGWSTITDMRPWFQCVMPYLAQKAIDDDYQRLFRPDLTSQHRPTMAQSQLSVPILPTAMLQRPLSAGREPKKVPKKLLSKQR